MVAGGLKPWSLNHSQVLQPLGHLGRPYRPPGLPLLATWVAPTGHLGYPYRPPGLPLLATWVTPIGHLGHPYWPPGSPLSCSPLTPSPQEWPGNEANCNPTVADTFQTLFVWFCQMKHSLPTQATHHLREYSLILPMMKYILDHKLSCIGLSKELIVQKFRVGFCSVKATMSKDLGF